MDTYQPTNEYLRGRTYIPTYLLRYQPRLNDDSKKNVFLIFFIIQRSDLDNVGVDAELAIVASSQCDQIGLFLKIFVDDYPTYKVAQISGDILEYF